MNDVKLQPCRICSVKKPLTKEYWYVNKAMKSGFDRRCKQCDNQRTAKRDKLKVSLPKNKPCMDCNQRFPSCAMSFDHRPEEGKGFDIHNKGAGNWASRLEEEQAKCDVVCLNCHAIRTWERRMGKKAQVIIDYEDLN